MASDESASAGDPGLPVVSKELDKAWGAGTYHLIDRFEGKPLKPGIELHVFEQNEPEDETGVILVRPDGSSRALFVTTDMFAASEDDIPDPDQLDSRTRSQLALALRMDAFQEVIENDLIAKKGFCGADATHFARFVIFVRRHWYIWRGDYLLLEPKAIERYAMEHFSTPDREAILQLARAPRVDRDTYVFNECSLDFLVLATTNRAVQRWIVRVPFMYETNVVSLELGRLVNAAGHLMQTTPGKTGHQE